MQTIQLHLYEKKELPVICATQGDVGRKFQAVITDGSLGYTIPADAGFTLWYSGTSGEGNYSFVGDNSAFEVSGDTVTVELITQMLACPGGGELCLCMSRPDGTWLGLWNIPYQVDALPGADSPEAVLSYTAFSDSVAKLQQAAQKIVPDDSLSESGRPADAAAVGAALAQKAPGGFGLGSHSVTEKESADECMSIGWYKVQNGGIYGDGDSCYIHTVAFGIDGGVVNIMQEGYRVAWNNVTQKMDYIKACRIYDGQEGWSEWEYENPPMTSSMPFRTTERINGKAVYKKLNSAGVVEYRLEGAAAFRPYAEVHGAAPAGFGLGALGTRPNDLNTCLTNGWYVLTDSTLNVPTEFIYGSVFVRQRLANQVSQHLYAHLGDSTGCQMIRSTVDGGTTWVEEWLNPPMVAGKEYRTTERWNGKPVYVMRMDCGTLPNSQSTTVTTTIPGTANIISACGMAIDSTGVAHVMPVISSDGKVNCSFFITSGKNISIIAYDDMSQYTVHILVKYTKT